MLIRKKALWLALFGSLALSACGGGGGGDDGSGTPEQPVNPEPEVPVVPEVPAEPEEPAEVIKGLNLRVNYLARDVTLEVKLNDGPLKTFTGTADASQNVALSNKLKAGDVLELALPSITILNDTPYACEFVANASMQGTLSNIAGQGLNQKITLTDTPENALYEVNCGQIHIVPAAYSGKFGAERYGWRRLNLDSGRSRWLTGQGEEAVVYVNRADETGVGSDIATMAVHWNDNLWRFVGATEQGTTSYVYYSDGTAGIEQTNTPVPGYQTLWNAPNDYPVWMTIDGSLLGGSNNIGLAYYLDASKNNPEDCGIWRWNAYFGSWGAWDLNRTECSTFGAAMDFNQRSAIYTLGDNVVYYRAQTGLLETFMSPGAVVGTVANPSKAPTVAGNKLYFPYTNGTNGSISVSDGTTLTDFTADVNDASGLRAALGNKLVFTSIQGDELWITDGTPAGTVLVKRIRNDGKSAAFQALTSVGNKVFFIADSGNGERLWVSDGTGAGTRIVDDTLAVTQHEHVAVAGDHLVFLAGSPSVNDVTDNKLYSTDGVTVERLVTDDLLKKYKLDSSNVLPCVATCKDASTLAFHQIGKQLLMQINGGLTAPAEGTSSKQTVYYWLTDGTAAGTRPLRDDEGKAVVSHLAPK
ncbi:hypothetical protein NUK34_10550 [Kerstersia gyiorum]|uniref:hypothetical protein n=1 Tax=Kerstersia gyiorum TaxID=206506 RepID=UPI0021506428|nr:hypothetical protein [Kerstersia gyiorum]MCR4159291.1 hypothetical protein [Kerstersia gyiorum]